MVSVAFYTVLSNIAFCLTNRQCETLAFHANISAEKMQKLDKIGLLMEMLDCNIFNESRSRLDNLKYMLYYMNMNTVIHDYIEPFEKATRN